MIKLAFIGFKQRWQDYLVLFSGLVMSSAIFYMFEVLATNQSFLRQNSTVSMAGAIFRLGSLLLTIITLVYIGYANSFLLGMRKRDYGLFMMVGARNKKIGYLIWLETTIVGLLAAIVGILVGILLTFGVSDLLVKSLRLTLKQFSPWYTPAAVVTLILYIGLFLIAGLFNWGLLAKTSTLELLHSNEQPNKNRLSLVVQGSQIITGLFSLLIGYQMLCNITTYKIIGLGIALITIVLGTYLLFNAVFSSIVNGLKHSNRMQWGLNTFTLSQLSFRIRNYTKILSVVSVLFALSLGAIVVGIGFHRDIVNMSNRSSAYDMGLVNPTNQQIKNVNKLSLDRKETYHYKSNVHYVYYDMSQFKHKPLIVVKVTSDGNIKYKNVSKTSDIKKYQEQINNLQSNHNQQKQTVFLSRKDYEKLHLKDNKLFVFATNELIQQYQQLTQIKTSQQNRGKIFSFSSNPGGRYAYYQLLNSIYSGMEFMGLFLGIAFLAMLASCLMFKILSGASADKYRYQILNKIGTSRKQIQHSIQKEIGVLFALPAGVGIIHVLFGLQIFKTVMSSSPYTNIGLPLILFGFLYFGYYLVTVSLYTKIVLK